MHINEALRLNNDKMINQAMQCTRSEILLAWDEMSVAVREMFPGSNICQDPHRDKGGDLSVCQRQNLFDPVLGIQETLH